jgi:DNA-binding Xre family transcriptional regulator
LVDTQHLENIIKEKGIKKSYLAEKLGISIQSLRLKINNISDFKNTETDTMCKELGITSLVLKEKIFFKK